GSKDEVPVKVTVTEPRTDADKNDPKGQAVNTTVGKTPNAKDGISNTGDLPAGTTYAWKETPDTATPGTKDATVVVTYPDGSKDEVPVKVNVTEPQTDADKITPVVPDKTPVTDPSHLTGGEKQEVTDKINDANKGNFPAGTKVSVGNDGTATITYPDNSTDTIPGDKLVTGKTSVDESGKTPVNPTDDAQDTGVVVKNPTKDTTVTAHDEDGHEVPVKINDQGHIVVTPGKDVDGPIKVTVDDPSMNAPVNVTVPVNGHEAGKNDNGFDKTDADKTTPVVPAKTPVTDPSHLTDGEKQEVTDKINDANKGNFPVGTKVSVGNDGTATITYPDGSQDTISGEQLVTLKDDSQLADANKVTGVKSAKQLTNGAKGVTNNQRQANKGQLPQTGNEDVSGLAVLGLATASLTMMLGFKRNEEK
ncbi:MAG: LPXTG cell wall anchor domain-containing protein, partial [Limosilactobacillus sp.]|nr:LPXTG cell wall anchor domain-containing protein [Limosilactobacillus sp.]